MGVRLATDPALMERLAVRVSHDIKSPLSVIRGLTHALRSEWDDLSRCDAAELLDVIESAVDRTADTAENLSELVRLPHFDDSPAPSTDLENVVSRAVSGVALRGGVCAVSGDWASVAIPAAEIETVIRNLVDNASHYGRDDDGRLHLIVKARSVGQMLEVTVADFGAGMADEASRSLFDPYTRAGQAGHPDGSGLGLTLARHVLRAWGGTVALDAGRLVGTALVLELPIAATAEGLPAPADAGPIESEQAHSPGDAVVVIADDEPGVVLALERALSAQGWVVHAAGDGPTALQLIRDQRPAMAVLDWIMPGLSGPAVCAAVRQEPAISETKLVLLTGRSLEDDVLAGLSHGADDYVTKPFDPRDIQRILRPVPLAA